MTFRDHPTDMMNNPDGRDYHYRFHANDEEAWKFLRFARWKGRMFELYPRDMKHLRVQIDHVTLKTYDKMGYIKGMKKYAMSPKWQKVPHSRGKKEMNHAHGGGSKIKAKTRINEKWGEVTVEYHVDATPGEIKEAFEEGVNENEISLQMSKAQSYAVTDKLEELRQKEAEYQRDCSHDHVVTTGRSHPIAYCEDCQKDWEDERELETTVDADEATVVGSVA